MEEPLLKLETGRYLLAQVETEWHRMRNIVRARDPESNRPWGVWVRQYSVVPEGFDGSWGTTAFPTAVWFVGERGAVPRSVWEYHRFQTVQFKRPWISASLPNDQNPLFSGRVHAIALAAFAPYEDGRHLYYEEIWGGLWGRGWRMTMDRKGHITEDSCIWVS